MIMHRKLATAALGATLLAASAPALAVDVSANLGYNSQYIFRGIPQKNSSAFGGLDLSAGGFYLGTWGADVGEGLEIDYYGGYGFDLGPVNLSAGGTLYTYTDDFDDTYQEFNFNASWEWLSFASAFGSYDNFDGPTLHYQYYSLKAEYKGFYVLGATFADDFDGNYYEVGYSSTLTVQDTDLFDYGLTIIYSDATLLGGDSDTNMVFTVSKSFDL